MFSRFERLSVSKRIFAGFGAGVAVLIAIVAVNVVNTNRLGAVFGEYRQTAQQSVEIGGFTRAVYDARLAVFEYTTRPSENAAVAVRKALGGLGRQLEESGRLFDGDDDVIGAVQRELATYRQAFKTVEELEARTSALIAEVWALEPKFEQKLNGFLFTARISSDQKSIDHGAAAILGFERGLSEFNNFLASEDAKRFEAAGPIFAEVRSELNSASSSLKIRGRDAGAVEATIETVDAIRGLLPRIGESVAARAVAREQLSSVGPRLLKRFVAFQDKIIARQGAIGARSDGRVVESVTVSLAIGAAGILLAIAMAWLIGRAISRAISRQAAAMSRLADGDLSVSVEGAEHGHELGRMAKALQVFKTNANRIAEMQEERSRRDAAAAAARAEMMEELRRSFGAVVDAAVSGDFSKRVEAEFADAELNELASGINRLVETVNAGLEETGRVLSQIARGDLSDRMHGRFDGAFAELKTNVNRTVLRLSELVEEITANIDIVGQGAEEISTGAADLSHRAEQQASSLQQTASTMEEMSVSVKTNADGATEAQSLATAASKRAESGGEIVRKAVGAMGDIEASAAKIAEIISVIDGIAFQTNLLALNAAVEAARAGDAGKGFAVVASEVRELAQRSSAAAQDIRGLIETSAGQVSEGVNLVSATGDALHGIVDSIGRVEETIGAIAAVSREQATGVEEISGAVAHMDTMTQQNSSLADQSAENARSLAAGAQKLRQLIAFFQLGASEREPGQDDKAA